MKPYLAIFGEIIDFWYDSSINYNKWDKSPLYLLLTTNIIYY